MRPAIDLLAQYAEYHRDRRNIASHFVGVPMITFGIGALLSHPAFAVGGLSITPAWVVTALVVGWFLTHGTPILGIVVSAITVLLVALAHLVGGASNWAWLAWGVSFFAVGWLVQFIGHWYEGKKPAFVDDLVFLLVGPMFLTAEALFALGWGKSLLAEIERRVGPTRLRDLARIA